MGSPWNQCRSPVRQSWLKKWFPHSAERLLRSEHTSLCVDTEAFIMNRVQYSSDFWKWICFILYWPVIPCYGTILPGLEMGWSSFIPSCCYMSSRNVLNVYKYNSKISGNVPALPKNCGHICTMHYRTRWKICSANTDYAIYPRFGWWHEYSFPNYLVHHYPYAWEGTLWLRGPAVHQASSVFPPLALACP